MGIQQIRPPWFETALQVVAICLPLSGTQVVITTNIQNQVKRIPKPKLTANISAGTCPLKPAWRNFPRALITGSQAIFNPAIGGHGHQVRARAAAHIQCSPSQ
jgi:hypothetical protein